MCIEKNAATQDRSYAVWGGGRENACLQEKETENATTHGLILVLYQKAGLRPQNEVTHTWAVDVHMNGLPDVLRLQKE